MFEKFLGVTELKTKADIAGSAYEADLPLITGTTIKQVRFNFDQGPTRDGNGDKIEIMASFAKSHGQDYVSGVKGLLEIIELADMKKRFVAKFQALQRIHRGTAGGAKSGREGAAKDNRAKGKCEVRIRKRNALPEANKYRDKKYDPAFFYQLMSEDEDEVNDGEPGKAKRYISRPPSYRSEELAQCFACVDAQTDPRPSTQYIPRVPGDPKEVPLPSTRTLDGRARIWMVKADWLREHEDSNNSRCIADSGRLWGDTRDPEEVEQVAAESAKGKKEKNAEKKKRKSELEEGGSGSKDLKKRKK